MTPERITELREALADRRRPIMPTSEVLELLDALDAAQQEIADLKRGGVVVPELTLEWCDEIWRNVPAELRKSIPECVQWIIQQDRARFVESRNRPWSNFLEARADAIDWLYADGNTDIEIAKLLSMDHVQVTRIRIRDRSMPGVVVLRMPHEEDFEKMVHDLAKQMTLGTMLNDGVEGSRA